MGPERHASIVTKLRVKPTSEIRPQPREASLRVVTFGFRRHDVTIQSSELTPQPLTALLEDERLFRDSVYEFADREIRPLVREMDEHAKIPKALVDKLFDLGVMGIEIPEGYGGSGARFFHAVLAVEALSRVDPSIGVLVDVQNTLVINALLAWGGDEIKRRYLPRCASSTIGAYALSEAGSGSDAFALATRATGRG